MSRVEPTADQQDVIGQLRTLFVDINASRSVSQCHPSPQPRRRWQRRMRLIGTSLVDSFADRDAFIASGMETGIQEGYERLDTLLITD